MSNKQVKDAHSLLRAIGQCVGVAIGAATMKHNNPYENAGGAEMAKGAKAMAFALDETLQFAVKELVKAGCEMEAVQKFAEGMVAAIDLCEKESDKAGAEERGVADKDISDVLKSIFKLQE